MRLSLQQRVYCCTCCGTQTRICPLVSSGTVGTQIWRLIEDGLLSESVRLFRFGREEYVHRGALYDVITELQGLHCLLIVGVYKGGGYACVMSVCLSGNVCMHVYKIRNMLVIYIGNMCMHVHKIRNMKVMYTFVCICVFLCVHMCVYIHAYMHVNTCIYAYVRIYIHMNPYM